MGGEPASDAPAREGYVLDSYAILAYLGGEEGSRRVSEILSSVASRSTEAYLSIINLGEVLYITERERGLARAQETLAMIEQMPVVVLPATREVVFAAAHIKAQYPVAYADAFAVAAARSRNATVLTGDPEFEAVGEAVAIDWI